MYIKNLYVDSKPFYDLIRNDTVFKWTQDHEKLFNKIKERISADTFLAIPDTRYPFHVHVDSSSIGIGSILVQEFPEGKRIISFNSRVYNKEEQKMSNTARELCGVVSALQTNEHYLLGSPHPKYLYTDHEALIYLWGRRGKKLSHRYFRYQLVISQFQNLKIIWNEGKNLAFPDVLSRNVTTKDLDKHQLKHKKIPKHIWDENGYKEKYFIVHDTKKGPSNELFPFIKQNKNGVTRFKINNDKLIKIPKETKKEQICSLTDISSRFIQGSAINQVRMIQNKIPNNNVGESDHNYSEKSFELNTNPTQFGDYMSNYDIEDQSDLLHFETIDEQDEIFQECLLNDETALCEQLTNKLENKKIATKLPDEILRNKDNLTQIFTSFNNLGKI